MTSLASKLLDILSSINESSVDAQSELTKLCNFVNTNPKQFNSATIKLDGKLGSQKGPNNLAGQLSCSFEVTADWNFDDLYTKELEKFYKLTADQIKSTPKFSHIMGETAKTHMYDTLKLIYAYFDKNIDPSIKIVWNYQRAFTMNKPDAQTSAAIQVLLNIA